MKRLGAQHQSLCHGNSQSCAIISVDSCVSVSSERLTTQLPDCFFTLLALSNDNSNAFVTEAEHNR